MEENLKEVYLYLDFDGKISADSLQNEAFIRIAHLDTDSPIVQVNDCIYQGTFDDALGTNLFFEENEDSVPTKNLAFEKPAAIRLKPFLKQSKVLHLRQMKVLPKKVAIPVDEEPPKLYLNKDYDLLIKKLQEGTLKLEDIEKEKEVEEEIPPVENSPAEEAEGAMEVETEAENEESAAKKKESNEEAILLKEKYKKLVQLAKRPTKRAVVEEKVMPCENKYKKAFEYHNLECQFLQPSDYFRKHVSFPEYDDITDFKHVRKYVDLDRSVLQKVIPPPEKDFLSEDHKLKLFSLNNIDNLSLAARYYVLLSNIDNLQCHINFCSKEELRKTDFYGRTSLDTLEIYKRLADALKKKLCISEIDETNDELVGDENEGENEQI